MRCPACAKETLEEAMAANGVVVDCCTACRGIWLDRGELDFFVKRPQELKPSLERAFASPSPVKRDCPRCGAALSEGRLDALSLDRCGSCGGLWTDESELQKLSALLDRSPAPDPTVGRERAGAPPVEARSLAGALLPALPNLAFRSGAVLAGMYGLLAAGLALLGRSGADPEALLAAGVLGVTLHFVLGPWLLDLQLRWAQGVRWTDPSELPPKTRRFLEETCRHEGVRVPSLGIIEDGNPNAFTYGHHPGNARLVVTRGAMTMLDDDELKAVVGHELGHILHWDMLVMTLAALVPMVFYALYRGMMRAVRRIKPRSGRKGDPRPPMLLIAAAAFLLYIVAKHLMLFLSRTRELHADRYSGERTGRPGDLASALVKIAYGLAGRKEGTGGEVREPAAAAQALGVFDAGSAKALVGTALGTTTDAKRAGILNAMQWDLWNPWAAYYELQSSHPLPARRIELLGRQAETLGQEPFVRFDLRQPESYWDEFLVDLLHQWAPGLGAAAAGFATWGMGNAPAWLGWVAAGFAAGYLFRLPFMYPGDGFPERSAAALLKVVKVSKVRGVPARLRGKIIGRGIPGHVLSEDLVLQDRTGFIFLDYTQPLSLMELWFALGRRPSLEGAEVEADGWYRRGPVPYFELRRIVGAEALHTSRTLEARWAFGLLLLAAGAAFGTGAVAL